MRLILVVALLLVGCADKQEYPDESSGYTAVSVFAKGGGTWQTLDAVVGQLAEYLDAPVTPEVIGGDGGLTGSQYAWDNRHKKRYLLFGALKSLETFKTQGKWDVGIEKFRVYSVWQTSAPVLAVSSKSDIKTPEQAISLLRRTAPTVATAGDYSSGDIGARTLAKLLKAQYKPVKRKSGAAAVEAVIFGEAQLGLALYSEMQDKIESGDLVPLVTISEIDGIYGDLIIKALGEFISEPIPELRTTFGYVIPADVDQEYIDEMDRAHSILNVSKVTKQKSLLPRIISGDLAMRELQKEIDADAWATSDAR